MTQALTREELRKELWRFTEWRVNAAAIEHLLTVIDTYAEQFQAPAESVVQTAEEKYFPPEVTRDLRRADYETAVAATNFRGENEVQAALEDLEPEIQDYDWKSFGHELAKLAWKYDIATIGVNEELTPGGIRRLAELSGLFGHSLAETHWMRVAAEFGDELAKAWLEDLGDGMAYTPGGELELVDVGEVVTRNDAIAAVRELESDEPTKVCRECGDQKPMSAFPPDKKYKDGRRSTCRLCVNKKRNEQRIAKRHPGGRPVSTPWVEDSSDDIAAGLAKRCSGPCGRLLSTQNFYHDASTKDGLTYQCKQCRREGKGG